MSLRNLVWILLIAVTGANAEPPKESPPPASTSTSASDIDVDAMARAKDAPAKQDTQETPEAATTPAPVTTDESGEHPAPPAPANAVELDRTALCQQLSAKLLDAAERSDYAAATHDFDALMRASLPPEKFAKAWGTLAQFGKLTARGQPHAAEERGYIAISTPLIFEKKNLFAQVACGENNKIAGFHVEQLPAPNSGP